MGGSVPFPHFAVGPASFQVTGLRKKKKGRLMMKIPFPCAAVLLSALIFSSAAFARPQETVKKIKKAPIAVTSAASGEEMFNTYCAVCHGTGGKGDGPAATEFKIPPANLTLLAQKHDGKYQVPMSLKSLRQGLATRRHMARKTCPSGALCLNQLATKQKQNYA